MAIYTVGYSGITPAYLLKLVGELQIDTVIDARSVPVTRKSGFGRRQLESLLGSKYQWRGKDLGGRPPGVTAPGLAELRSADKRGLRRLVMCLEHGPGDCHRHWTIGLPLARQGVEVFHVADDELIEPIDLQHAIDAGAPEYDCWKLKDHIAELARLSGGARAPRHRPPANTRRTQSARKAKVESTK
jgi:uncharacterized protein (DUF488 family)